MSSSSSHQPDPPSDPPDSKSAMRPAARPSTFPGLGPLPSGGAVEASPATAVSNGAALDDASAELPFETERVTLLNRPCIARYGSYELLGRVAYGGMAEIFLGREIGRHDTRRLLVIKRVLPHVVEDPHFVDMFIDEARLAMQLNHPNICHVYNFGEAAGTYYIAMEWVNGKPLSKIIKRARDRGGLPIPIALKIIAQVAEALDYAHRACDAAGEPLGIVHRDVSPQNIMVSYDGVVKLLDFGIAKATSHSTRTEAGVIKGKFAYMSPQQCLGEPIDARADVFALGVCLFEALTGRNAFRRKTEFETMTKIVGEPTPRVRTRRPDVPEAVEAIVDRAMAKQPEHRYQTAGEMQFAIEAELSKLGELVNSSRLGDYLSALFAEEVRDGPELDTKLHTSIPPPRSIRRDDRTQGGSSRPPSTGSTEPYDTTASTSQPPQPLVESRRTAVTAGALVLLVGLAGTGGLLAWALLGQPESGHPRRIDAPAVAPPEVATDDRANERTGERDSSPGPNEPPATAGSIFIESIPPGATISLDDRPMAGTTPLDIGMLAPGTYAVRLTLEGHEEWTRQVTVRSGERATLTAELAAERPNRPAPTHRPSGRLSLNTRPWSKVYLGPRLLGTTPLGRVSVPSGTHRLRLVDRDGTEHRRTVRIPPGGHVAERYDLRAE